MGTEFGVLSTGFGLSGEWRKSHTDADLNYTLYLVTDSSPQILGDRDLCDVVEQAIKGGVTIVQLREKNCDTREFIEKARRLHAITKKYDVPLLINDRIDVALAVNCEGVHIGQDDMGELRTAGLSNRNLSQLTYRARHSRGQEAAGSLGHHRCHSEHCGGGHQGRKGWCQLSRHWHYICHFNVRRRFACSTAPLLNPAFPPKQQEGYQAHHRHRGCCPDSFSPPQGWASSRLRRYRRHQ
jgi:Thiamine monophosphate synthase